MTGKTLRSADFKGKVALLRFNLDSERWEKFYNEDLVDFLQELGASDRLRVVSFEKTGTRAELEGYDEQRQVPWEECWIGDAKGEALRKRSTSARGRPMSWSDRTARSAPSATVRPKSSRA